MQQNTQSQGQPKENFFDEGGNDISAAEVDTIGEDAAAVSAETPEAESTEQEAAAPEQSRGKYRIGDREFATQEEAIAYAQTRVQEVEIEQQIAEAYRTGIRDGITQPRETVTPQAAAQPEVDTAEFYTNPEAFLARYAQRVKSEVLGEVEHSNAIRSESDRIWSEFSQRHPMLADFRREVERFAEENLDVVQAIIKTKGRTAGYDYVATKIKARAEAIAQAGRPARALPNTGTAAAPAARTSAVTAKQSNEKSLSMGDAIRSMRTKRRS